MGECSYSVGVIVIRREKCRFLSMPHITVIGSYATGLTLKVKRLPSPGETVLASGYRVDYGGKGSNQAVGCARLGAKVSFVARIGKDTFGEMALRLYREEGIENTFIDQSADHHTGVGFILVEEAPGIIPLPSIPARMRP